MDDGEYPSGAEYTKRKKDEEERKKFITESFTYMYSDQ
jgi:hypothetical protein